MMLTRRELRTEGTYPERSEELKMFIKLIDESSNGAVFAIACTLHGIGHMTEPAFFRDRLLPFMLGTVERWLIKYKIALRDRLPKLQGFYKDIAGRIPPRSR